MCAALAQLLRSIMRLILEFYLPIGLSVATLRRIANFREWLARSKLPFRVLRLRRQDLAGS